MVRQAEPSAIALKPSGVSDRRTITNLLGEGCRPMNPALVGRLMSRFTLIYGALFLMKAIVLLSGGLDSATTLAIARREGFGCHALTFHYGQRHRREIDAARRVARSLGVVEHRLIGIDLRALGGSALTDSRIEVPKDRPDLGDSTDIPLTYVPARNTIFLSYALAWAEVLGAFDLFIGVNSTDYSGYPDCRVEFIAAFEAMANLATAAAVQGRGRYEIHVPIIRMSKAEIIRTGMQLGVDYSLTHSCYDPDPQGRACGRCDSCRLRLKGFAEAGVPDPIPYVERLG